MCLLCNRKLPSSQYHQLVLIMYERAVYVCVCVCGCTRSHVDEKLREKWKQSQNFPRFEEQILATRTALVDAQSFVFFSPNYATAVQGSAPSSPPPPQTASFARLFREVLLKYRKGEFFRWFLNSAKGNKLEGSTQVCFLSFLHKVYETFKIGIRTQRYLSNGVRMEDGKQCASALSVLFCV